MGVSEQPVPFDWSPRLPARLVVSLEQHRGDDAVRLAGGPGVWVLVAGVVSLSVMLAVSVAIGSVASLLVSLVLVLVLLVGVQVRLERVGGVFVSAGASVRTPFALAVGVVMMCVLGSFAAAVLALVLNSVGVGGDGSLLLELLVPGFALIPCFRLGADCGRWWSFTGGGFLLLLLIVCLAFTGGSVLLVAAAAAAASVALSAGSLHRTVSRRRLASG
jgi:hypothetical protein